MFRSLMASLVGPRCPVLAMRCPELRTRALMIVVTV